MKIISSFVSSEKLVGELQINQRKSPREKSNGFKVLMYLSCFP